MYCRYCGKKVSDQVKFCPYCGKAIGLPKENIYQRHEKMRANEKARVQAATSYETKAKVSKKKLNKKNAIAVICAVAVGVCAVGIGVSKSHTASTLFGEKVQVNVIDRMKSYDENGDLYHTDHFHYDSSGLVKKINKYGDDLDDIDQSVFTYKDHKLVSIKDTCPTGEDDSVIDTFEYQNKDNNYLSKLIEKTIPGRDSDSKESTTGRYKFVYKTINGKQRVDQNILWNGNKDKYLATCAYTNNGYMKSFTLKNLANNTKYEYDCSYDSHGTILQEGYKGKGNYYKYTNNYDDEGKLIKYTYSDTNNDSYKDESVIFSYKTITINAKYQKAVKIQQQYYLRNGQYSDEGEFNYFNDLADALKNAK